MAIVRPPQRVRTLRRPVGTPHAPRINCRLDDGSIQLLPKVPPAPLLKPQTKSPDTKPSIDTRINFASDLETEIIPRLLLAHGSTNGQQGVPDQTPLIQLQSSVRARQLCHVALRESTPGAVRFVEKLLEEGRDIDLVLTEIVAGAARQMGQLWESDDLDFVEVTLGVSVLQQTVRHLSTKLPAERRSASRIGGRAAFAPSCGEQHTFGLLMVEELYRAYGWDVAGGGDMAFEDICKIASEVKLEVVGLTLSTDDRLDQLTSEIDILRVKSCSPKLTVLVGGNAFLENPNLWRSTGADAMAIDAIEAIRIGERLLSDDTQQVSAVSSETQPG